MRQGQSQAKIIKPACFFKMQTATGREDFAYWDHIASQIFIQLISNEEKILGNVTVVV